MSGYGDLIPAYEVLKVIANEAKESQYKNMSNSELLDFYSELGYWKLHHTIMDVRNEILNRMETSKTD